MAHQGFKKWWAMIVPEPLERSTYVLIASLVLALIFHKWQPMPDVVWNVANPIGRAILTGLFWIGWLIVLLSTFLIDHFDLFGLRQVYLYLSAREYTPLQFKTPTLYRCVRHPIYLGFIIAFWATPRMTVGHLVLAIATTAYIFIGIWLEERDMISQFGETYSRYRQRVSLLIPLPPKGQAHAWGDAAGPRSELLIRQARGMLFGAAVLARCRR
jgi:protein-S-isoprenylcysteine O-methyltransferase Ste14